MAWRILACYAFIKIKLASCHLLFYVVYTCQIAFNFIEVFNCYKKKCKMAPFNSAHPVDGLDRGRGFILPSHSSSQLLDTRKRIKR